MNMKNKKITIQHYTTIVTPSGFEEQTWLPLLGGENIWAYYRQASGSEFYTAATVNEKVEAIFQINWRNDIDTSMQILYNNEKYNITRIDDFEGYKTDLKIYAYKVNEG